MCLLMDFILAAFHGMGCWEIQDQISEYAITGREGMNMSTQFRYKSISVSSKVDDSLNNHQIAYSERAHVHFALSERISLGNTIQALQSTNKKQ